MTPQQLLAFLENLSGSDRSARIAEPIVRELRPKLQLLQEVGLSYLTLDRGADTLSGGESQRIRLVAQVASNLTGVAYVLDEPTIGLHPHDSQTLIAIMRRLQQQGNSVIIVEHDEDTIRSADHIIDLGPGGGTGGGDIVAAGTLSDIVACADSATGRWLARTTASSRPPHRPVGAVRQIAVIKAAAHNLRDITVRFPVGRLTVVSGVSGAGKTTLVREVLYKGLKKNLGQFHGQPGTHARINGTAHVTRVVEIDQSPIGKTPRSIPATYIGFFDDIRRLFAGLPEARLRGYGPSRFSFNTGSGRCAKCTGQGKTRIAMNFLPDMYVDCDACNGSRFNQETLQIRYRDHSIADILQMTVDEACAFFDGVATVHTPLRILQRMGLGYLTLGQPSTTLSGGEAQRIKIAAELVKSRHGKNLYIFDEPTTGLHATDIAKLMHVLQELVDLGNTVVIIEHNLDVIAQADYLVDLGPWGGDGGGRIVACGPPDQIAAGEFGESQTARFLRNHLQHTAGAPD